MNRFFITTCLAVQSIFHISKGQTLIDVTKPPYSANGFDSFADDVEIQKAIDTAYNNNSGIVYIPKGTYIITNSIKIGFNSTKGVKVIGEDVANTILESHLTGDDPVFEIDRNGEGSSDMSNTSIRNLQIAAHVNYTRMGTGIKFGGQQFAVFDNIKLRHLQKGIWLYQDATLEYSEINKFRNVYIDECSTAVVLEAPNLQSFHGTVFDQVSIGLGANHTAIHHKSGHYYNANFRFLIWVKSTSSVILNSEAGAIAENNLGQITIENCQNCSLGGIVKGSGRFSFSGTLSVASKGEIQDLTTPPAGQLRVVTSDNFWTKSNTTYDPNFSNYNPQPVSSIGLQEEKPYGLQRMKKGFMDGHSYLLNSEYSTGWGDGVQNGLYLGRSGDRYIDSKLGLFLSDDGKSIESYSTTGLTFNIPNAGLKLKQSGNSSSHGFYIERSGEPMGAYLYTSSSNNDAFTIAYNNSGSVTDRLQINRDGNIFLGGKVGVGTTSPKSEMQVNGYLQISTINLLRPIDSDCHTDAKGRMVITTNPSVKLWICNGAGWKSAAFD